MEKLVKEEIECKLLANNRLNDHQHAFRSGRSCETALAEVVGNVEAAVTRGQFALGIFLDIAGAFDNLLPEAAILGMKNKGISQLITNWYGNYLTKRTITLEKDGIRMIRSLRRGTPQGGVLSPLVWNLAFDDLLDLCNRGPAITVGFADDACIIVTGPDPNTLVDVGQNVVDSAVEWGKASGLDFNATKSAVLLFSNRYKVPSIKNILINGVEVQKTDSTKYLGVMLDTKLSFGKHINNKLKKAKGLMLGLKNAVGKLWGPSPIMMSWVFKCIVIPMITYGAVVWGHRAKLHHKELGKLQRLAMLMITSVPRSAPTKGLEVILGYCPLRLVIEGVGIKSQLRINSALEPSWDGIGYKNKRGHFYNWNKLIDKYQLTGFITDKVNDPPVYNFGFKVNNDKDFRLEEGSVNCINLGIFKVHKNKQYTIMIRHHDQRIVVEHGSWPDLVPKQTVELLVLEKLADHLKAAAGKVLISEFKADLTRLRLKGSTQKSIAKNRVIKSLNKLAEEHEVVLVNWDVVGRHAEGLLTIFGSANAQSVMNHSSKNVPLPAQLITETINKHIEHKWNESWKELDSCRQTKKFWPHVSIKTSKSLIKINDRGILSKMIQIVTGHGFNNFHLSKIEASHDPLCQFCLEEDEETWHVVMECVALEEVRYRFLTEGNSVSNLKLPEDLLRLPDLFDHIGSLFDHVRPEQNGVGSDSDQSTSNI